MMKRSIKRVITAVSALTLAVGIAITPASAVYYSNSFAIDATGEEFAIPEAYRYMATINIFDDGFGVLDSPSDICFDENGMLYVVDKDNARILIMDGDGVIKAVIGGSMPDGTDQFEEDVESEEEEETESEENEVMPIDNETSQDASNIIEDSEIKDAQLERTDYYYEVFDLHTLDAVLSKANLLKCLDGSLAEGKSIENLTIALSGDFTISSALEAALLKVEPIRYRYYYTNPVDPSTQRQETLELTINFEIPEGRVLTVNTALDMEETNIVNHGTLVVTSKGKLDVTDCFIEGSGRIVQYVDGAIFNTSTADADVTVPSIPEGTRATFVVTEGDAVKYTVDFTYLYLKAPEGICVDANGKIYICDTDGRRIITMNSDFSNLNYITEEMVRKESTNLGSSYNFTPSKIGVSNTGMMYILNKSNYRGFLTLNKDGKFCGFVGATKVTASVGEVLVQILGTAAQKQAISNKQPAPATNLYVVENMVYSVVKPSSTEPNPKRIQKINVVGSDLFPDGEYVISSYSPEEQERVSTNYVDVCVDDYGILTVIDDELGYIVQLNQLGEIIACFGGKSNRQGQFLLPTALDIHPETDRIYVADSLKGSIQVFEPTHFIDLVHEASDLYFEGLYSEAVTLWEEVAAIDETYDLAHVGVAESLFGDGLNLDAMNKFKYAWNYDGYDKAFAEFRLSLFRYYFAPVVLSILALIILLAFGFVALKRKSDDLYK